MPVLASSQQEFSDADWRAVSSGDQSKKLKLLLSAISANTTRVLTMPDADVIISAFVATLLDDTTAAAFLTTLGVTLDAGIWTPSVGGTATYNLREGHYVRVGIGGSQMVFFDGMININAIGTGSQQNIDGLPYSLLSGANTRGGVAIGFWSGLAASYVHVAATVSGTAVSLRAATAASAALSALNAMTSGSVLYFFGAYASN